jgi:GntR family transcriptional regulator/MocR family aminotransferase
MIPLQTDRKTPFYEQIYQAIRQDIETGRLPCGSKLASTRLLAQDLSVSRFTVNLAYEQLVSEGYIQARAGSGFFVCDLSELLTGPVLQKQTPPRKKQKKQEILVDFSPFLVDTAHFPYNSWKKCSRQVLDDSAELLTPTGAAGDEGLRIAIADYLYRARGVHCEPEQIIVGAGNDYLLTLLAQLLGRPPVLMENPTYMQAYQVLQHAGCQVQAGDTDGEGLCRPKDGAVLYIMPSHQFPMGTVMPLGRRRELLDWAAERPGRYIIEDDHDSEFRYVGKPIPSLQSRDKKERVVYIGTFSKSISPSLRISYMVLPPHLLERFRREFGFFASTVSSQQQRALAHFMAGGDFERHLNRMRRIYKGKHDFLLRELKKRPWVSRIRGEQAGLHLLVWLESARSEEELIRQAMERGVRIYGMSSYEIGRMDTKETILLFGFGGLDEEAMLRGLAILDDIASEHRR